MRVTFRGQVPPDHPLFRGGVGFVFRSDLPESEQDESERDADEHDES